MHAFFLLFISSFLLCFGLTPLCRDIFIRRGLVDHPDSNRKFHLRAVPRIGGLPIALAYAGSLLLVLSLPGSTHLYIQHERLFLTLLPAASIVFAIGLVDDIVTLLPWQKLAGQFAAAVLAVFLGARLAIFPRHPSISIVFSIMWLIGCTNAVNLIDGMDGLATGVGLFATLTTLFFALASGNSGLALAIIPLAGCLLAFLRYNFSPATVFLGDCGSLTIGFALGCISLIWSEHAGTLVGMAGPLMLLALPLIDVCLAIGRRFLRNVSITTGDRSHIHHMVLRLGFSTRGAALVLYGVCALAAALAILVTMSQHNLRWPIFCIFCALVLVGVNRLGYIEFSAARRILSHTFMRRAVQDEIYLHELDLALFDVDTLDSWWNIVCNTCAELQFASAEFHFNGQSRHQQFVHTPEVPSWRIQLGFGSSGFFVLTRMQDAIPPRVIFAVIQRLQDSIADRVQAFDSPKSQISTAA